MGKILPTYRKALIEEVVNNITANSSQYYAFASHPLEYDGPAPEVSNNDYDTTFTFNWNMLFGKKLNGNDVVPVITKNIWTSNTVYEMYDNTSDTIYSNNVYYAITEPSISGGLYHVYKCIDNANGSPSTVDPSSIGTPRQPSTFTTDDGYKWRYLATISAANYEKFSSNEYAPIYTDATISATADNYAGVDVVMISNAGSGYTAYRNNPNTDIIQSNPNSTLLQIADSASDSDNFYVNSAIYIYNTIETTSQLRIVSDYVVNSSGKFVVTDTAVNTSLITPGLSKYIISPAVIFESDGDSNPSAYCTVNTSNYSISEIVMLNSGSNISWANVSIQSGFGSGANVYAIVPPPGGHGADPVSELNVKGLAVSFNFANNESQTLPTANLVYNKIGIVKNPHALVANTAEGSASKGELYKTSTFDNLYVVNVSPSYTFTKGETIIGANSGSRGVVVFSNSTQAYVTCDQTFIDGEFVANTVGANLTTIAIQTTPDIYTKDLKPIYVENINNINRSNNQTESYKLIIEI
jgi:hypothetical protein